MARALAKELAPSILVNVVAPGVLETGITSMVPETVKTEYLKHCAQKRFGTHEDRSRSIAWLALANTYITARRWCSTAACDAHHQARPRRWVSISRTPRGVTHADAWSLLWMCDVAMPILALGCFARRPRAVATGFLFLLYGALFGSSISLPAARARWSSRHRSFMSAVSWSRSSPYGRWAGRHVRGPSPRHAPPRSSASAVSSARAPRT